MGLFTFIDRFRASSSDRSPWGDFFFEPVSVRSASGMRVSPDGALRLAAVYAGVRILSETMASLPVVVYRQRKDGGKDRVTDHWLYGLLARKPNRFQNPFEWREMLQGHLALRGNAFCQIIANPKGEITELMPIHPDRVRMEVMDSGDFRYRVRMQNGDETVFPRGQIWHLRGLSSDGLMGMSPIELARESLGMALAAQDYGARFFTNDAKPTGGWIEFPGTFKDPEAKRVFRDSYHSSSRSGGCEASSDVSGSSNHCRAGLSVSSVLHLVWTVCTGGYAIECCREVKYCNRGNSEESEIRTGASCLEGNDCGRWIAQRI